MTLRYLLDTSIVSEPMAKFPNSAVLSQLRRHTASSAIAAPVWHEVSYGVELMPNGKRRRSIERYLQNIVRRSFPILPYDEVATAWHASERARLAVLGRPAPYVDGQIAAIAMVNGLVLVTLNEKDFTRFSDLDVENWSDN